MYSPSLDHHMMQVFVKKEIKTEESESSESRKPTTKINFAKMVQQSKDISSSAGVKQEAKQVPNPHRLRSLEMGCK